MEKIPDWRFLVVADKRTEEEEKQYAFFFKEKGTDQDIRRLIQAFLKDVKKNHDTVEGWGAKRLMVFLKVYTERRGHFHITGILDFTTADLAEELIAFRCASFMKLWSDRYDKNAFPTDGLTYFVIPNWVRSDGLFSRAVPMEEPRRPARYRESPTIR